MGWLEGLLLCWHRLQTRRKMERVFSRREDPYGYRELPYERARLAAMGSAIEGRRYRRALEVGCAEGAFTGRLARAAERVTALDVSRVALKRARRLVASARVEFVAADVRDWSPPPGSRYDLIVLGDVLYYLDKPLVRGRFEKTLSRLAGWLAPGGRMLLAHGFAGKEERRHREGFRASLEEQGLRLVSESVAEGPSPGPVACLVSLLESPGGGHV